ncbi:hypothetical protein [Enterobacter ludwigii]|uniref:hypothetical protein n=1 Tax=Enterobacter ludwigii TaxID=299767 RepID=UPI000A5E2689|nr:hypothetical protein [Enterobacter ludwigii]MCR5990991.1 hypothetical protein [Enterobacter ludwigii]
MLRMTIVMFLLITSISVRASTMNYSCDKGYYVTVSVDGKNGFIKVFKYSKPVALTKSDKFHIELESHAYDMDGSATFNYSAYKGYDHTVESLAVSDFYTLITKNTILSKPSENSKLLIRLSGQNSFLVNCKLTLDLPDLDFSK